MFVRWLFVQFCAIICITSIIIILCLCPESSCLLRLPLVFYTQKLASFVKFALANTLETLERENRQVVLAFYEALASGDVQTVQGLLASDDLEWRFHGPPSDQYLMQFLTGAAPHDSYVFTPVSVRAIGDKVFAEGQSYTPSNKCWVHVWTVKGGKIIQLREYFNTALSVVGPFALNKLQEYLWESRLGKSVRKSIPSLILAI
ncbi:hypothetical protein GOP47_0024473 [Adiantum capillus-veneris]|uniref:SnoaL-like domain-containing protein n=1 Tax=Adiantum capillus-veneris TaxID=13818 RepID=A0A9D4Z2S3_ADICA|nr:hypothetical protein GOP47_0024473 [Adiantum capillus-veneris]